MLVVRTCSKITLLLLRITWNFLKEFLVQPRFVCELKQ
jgi:hypothetical protein